MTIQIKMVPDVRFTVKCWQLSSTKFSNMILMFTFPNVSTAKSQVGKIDYPIFK